jgi:hypothetical protein
MKLNFLDNHNLFITAIESPQPAKVSASFTAKIFAILADHSKKLSNSYAHIGQFQKIILAQSHFFSKRFIDFGQISSPINQSRILS